MHELSLATDIVKIAIEQATAFTQPASDKSSKEEKDRINIPLVGIKLKVGVLTGIFPDSLHFYLDLILKEQGFENVSIQIESVDVRYTCSCGNTYIVDSIMEACPACGQFSRTLVEGNDCLIESIELSGNQAEAKS
jgi:hydrogenase nickel insertion protein HypA